MIYLSSNLPIPFEFIVFIKDCYYSFDNNENRADTEKYDKIVALNIDTVGSYVEIYEKTNQ
jgi:hypothetical protein